MNLEKIKQLAIKLQEEADKDFRPPQEIIPVRSNDVLVSSSFAKTRGYIEKIVFQINKCYGEGCYDACAVMIRRLIEILIIEVFEAKNMSAKIKDGNDNFLFLEDLITKILNESPFNLSRKTKTALGKKEIKTMGDISAHGRRYNACRKNIDDIKTDLAIVAQELLYLSGLTK